MFLFDILSIFMLVSFSWSLGYFCLYERTSDVSKWNGTLWYLLFLLVYEINDLANFNLYIGLLIVFLTTLLTPLNKFPNGHHYIQNLDIKSK